VRESPLPDDDVLDIAGIRATAPLRTMVDLVVTRELVEAVVALDAFLQTQAFTLDELKAYAQQQVGRRNIRRISGVIALADGRAESPMETRLRLLIVLAGLPVPDVQHEVWSGDRFFGRLDLAYPWCRLGIEFDGALHDSALRSAADIRRTNALIELGWRLLRFDASDVFRRPGLILSQVRAALSVAA
jgi:hypothetical protein